MAKGRSNRQRRTLLCAFLLGSAVALGAGFTSPGVSAQQAAESAVVIGRVLDASTGEPVSTVRVIVEGTERQVLTDGEGRFRLTNVPPGPQVLRAERVGYSPSRTRVTVPTRGELQRDLEIAVRALEVDGITVTADASGRARGELGTATVVGRDAIRTQTSASLAGVLELIPGATLQPPGLDGVQQISLRAVPATSGGPANIGMASAGDLSSFGTLIILDGVPVSNNANLQSLGPRGELAFTSSAGGGVDLRRIPASTLERVEVIRGIPSARFGDLTQGAIVVDTRAGAIESEMLLRYDARTGEVTLLGGRQLGDRHAATASLDVARTRMTVGTRDDHAHRVATQLSHRAAWGGQGDLGNERLTLDTRLDFFRMEEDQPEVPDLQPGFASQMKDTGLRISHRAQLRFSDDTDLMLTAALDRGNQESYRQSFRLRPAMPFTSRLTEGREEGFYVGGQYLAAVSVDGSPRQFFTRLEGRTTARALGVGHELRAGVEGRREGNEGAGFQFDMATPPQVSFNGVNGFDRPRRFDEIPAQATTSLYVDDRMTRVLGGDVVLRVQAGLRVDVLHDGSHWFSSARDAVLQPRFTAELSPVSWMRLRAGAGRTAKMPSLQQLYPAPQFYDVVNVNWFANNPAERLAVLSTFILDPGNPELGMSRADKLEAGFEVDLGPGATLSVVAFEDRIRGGVGLDRQPGFFLRDYFQLSDSTLGTGRQPQIIEPASSADTVPVLLDQPANNLGLTTRGIEFTASLPEIRLLRTRVHLQGALIENRLDRGGYEFSRQFSEFQMRPDRQRVPYWEGASSTGERGLVTARIVHHQPLIGLVVTGTIQHVFTDTRRDLGEPSNVSFEGYLTRDGRMVPVPEGERENPEFEDIREGRVYLVFEPQEVPNDWIMSLQVSKTLPADGRLAFYAFNALDRRGRFGEPGVPPRTHAPVRVGLELSIPAGALVPWR